MLPQPLSRGTSLNGAAPQHEFLPDSRIEQIFNKLHRELRELPDETQYATTVDPAQWVEVKGVAVLQPERVIFWAVVPNPQKRWKGKLIKQYATIDMADWRQAEITKFRFAGVPDPAYIIFRSLSMKLIAGYKNWSELQ